MTRASEMCTACGGEEGYCRCSEGCAPGAAAKGRMLEWLLLGALVLLILVVVAERLMWILGAAR